jgi:hypothetical protein
VDEPALIRSYQRIFKPERRICQVEGRSLPVPGGIPLRWLAWADLAAGAGNRNGRLHPHTFSGLLAQNAPIR